MVKDSLATEETQEDNVSIPESGRSPGGGHSTPLQYSCLENSMDRGAWWAAIHGVAKSWIRLSVHAGTHTHTHKKTSWGMLPFLSSKLHDLRLRLRFGAQLSRRREGGEEGRVGHCRVYRYILLCNYSSLPSHFRSKFEVKIVLLGLILRDPEIWYLYSVRHIVGAQWIIFEWKDPEQARWIAHKKTGWIGSSNLAVRLAWW